MPNISSALSLGTGGFTGLGAGAGEEVHLWLDDLRGQHDDARDDNDPGVDGEAEGEGTAADVSPETDELAKR